MQIKARVRYYVYPSRQLLYREKARVSKCPDLVKKWDLSVHGLLWKTLQWFLMTAKSTRYSTIPPFHHIWSTDVAMPRSMATSQGDACLARHAITLVSHNRRWVHLWHSLQDRLAPHCPMAVPGPPCLSTQGCTDNQEKEGRLFPGSRKLRGTRFTKCRNKEVFLTEGNHRASVQVCECASVRVCKCASVGFYVGFRNKRGPGLSFPGCVVVKI